jgi:hypothetical protein
MTTALIFLALAVSLLARAAILHVSASAAVDHYYWLLAARAYREKTRLPARIPDKYFLEDERQAYPPFFGWFLSLIPEGWLTAASARWYSQVVDGILITLMLSYAWTAGLQGASASIIVFIIGTAPVLAAYNTQLTSRAFGNLFLTIAVLAALGGSHSSDQFRSVALLAFATIAVAAVVLTHKMSFQLLAFCWPVWAIIERDWRLAPVPVAGVLLSSLLTGLPFAKLQWRAHWEIVAFWHKHRDELGAHAFNDSPVYGNERRGATLFHQPGLRGAFIHFVRAFSYNPFAWLVPTTLLWLSAPPDWVVIWTLGPLVLAILTLYVPQLRCLGGGHLYVFNSVAPSALWWAFAVVTDDRRTFSLLVVAAAAALVALLKAYRTRKAGAAARDPSYRAALEYLAGLNPDRLAVFPFTAAEEAAFRTPHAVLWGGHALTFPQLEPVFPVLRKSVGEILRDYRCSLFLFDTRYWPEGEACAERELTAGEILSFGPWRVVRVPTNLIREDASPSCVGLLA